MKPLATASQYRTLQETFSLVTCVVTRLTILPQAAVGDKVKGFKVGERVVAE